MNIFTFSQKVLVVLCIFISISIFSQTSDFKVQHLQDDISNGGGTNTSFTPISSLNNALALPNNNRKTHAGINGNTGNLEGDDLSGARLLTNTNTLTYHRESGSSNSNMRFNTSIWEYIGPASGNNEMIIRGRYAVSLNGIINSTTESLTGIVNANHCIPFITGIRNDSASNNADSGTAIAFLENSTTLRVEKGSNANNVTVYITLVEFTGSNWTVLHGDSGNASSDTGTITLRNGSDGTGTATNVDAWNEAIIFTHHRGDMTTSGINQAIADNWPITAPGSNNQSVNWTFNSNHDSDSTNSNRHFVHVLTNSGLNVSRFQNTSNGANETTLDISSAGLSDINEALIVGTSISSGGGTAYARGWRNYYFNSTSQAAHWSHRSGNTMSHEIQIIDLSALTTTLSLPEINLIGNGTNINSGNITPSALDDTEFGLIANSTTLDRTFTIQNTGSATLNLTGTPRVAISGNGAFSIQTQPSANSISSGGNLTFVVRFAPTADLTNAQATISIDNNDLTASEAPYTFMVQGSSETPAPEINITGLGNSIADGDSSPSLLDDTYFGDVLLTNSSTKTYTIENTGSADLDISSINISNTAGNGFSIVPTNPAPATISSGNNITFSVIFTPTSTSPTPYEAEITISNTDANESSYNFIIQGVGTENIVSAGPGNVSLDLQLWMRADEGISVSEAVNNAEVTSWGDQSTNALSAIKDGEPGPNYIADGLNFNPVLRFDRTNQNYLTLGNPTALNIRPGASISGRKDMTIIAAFVANGNSNAGSVISKADNSVRDYQLWLGDTDRVVHYTYGRDNSPSYDGRHWGRFNALNEPKITRGVAISTGLTSTVNGLTDNLVVNYGLGNGDSSNRDVLIGARRNSSNSDDANQLTGDVAEIIIYDRALTTTEAEKVESYLAIKYGITLGYNDSYRDGSTITNFSYSGTSNDYIASNGTTLWNGADNAGYGYNVFGIARDNNSNLLQSKSKSANVQRLSDGTLLDPILTIQGEAGSLTSDLSYLLVGHQGSDIALQTSTVPERATNTISRQWKARESITNVGTVQLEFDLSQYTITDEDQLNLLVADNASLNNYKNYEGSYDAATDILTFTSIDLEDNDYFTLGTVEILNNDYHMSFDGSTQYIDLGDNNDLTSSFTISAWVKYDTFGRVLVSKGGSSGYEFGFDGTGNLVMSWENSGTYSVTSNNSVPRNIWHHVAVIYNQSTAKLYIDGIENGSANIGTSPIGNATSCFIGATSGTPNNFYSGEMDELRIWNIALTVNQLRFIMNQEIENNGDNVYGKIIPNNTSNHDTSSIDWGDLLAYYTFSETRGNCLLNESESDNHGRLYNTITSAIEDQTTPLPYESQTDGLWDENSTWLNNSVQVLPNSFWSIDGTTPIDWNIVEINNNIYLGASASAVRNRNCTVEGLIINSGDLQVNGNTASNTGIGLTVTHYLKINGSLDLEGESQLIQTTGSYFDATSTGNLERDQQGNSNIYTYNFWCSPISSITNTSYTVPSVITNVGFTSSGYNGIASPLTNADYWIYKYADSPDNYYQWKHVRSSGTLLPGEGFTMKGTGVSASEQNYIFEGQPNNGNISLNITLGNKYLVGNPYPSALDADEFIKDNLGVADGGNNASGNIINGALYFWDHFSENTHILREYEGGYATYTLMGGAFAISNDPLMNASGAIGTSRPERYIPVGQGFFVSAILDTGLIDEDNDPEISQSIVGGDILFKNSQRVFQKENVTLNNSGSIFLKPNSNKKSTQTSSIADERQKLRLSFLSPSGYRRQLLVGADENASNKFDLGYEAVLIESNKADMYWKLNNTKLIIQAVNKFDLTQKIPLGLKTNNDGVSKISIDDLINIPADKAIYIHDLAQNSFHNLRDADFEIFLPKGTYDNRFELSFENSNENALTVDEFNQSNIEVYYNNEKGTLNIYNPNLKTITTTEMFNILGQSVFRNDKKEQDKNVEYRLNNISKGPYIINIKSDEGTLSKKILIK